MSGFYQIMLASFGFGGGREIYRAWQRKKDGMPPAARRRAGRWEAAFWVAALTAPGLIIAEAISSNF